MTQTETPIQTWIATLHRAGQTLRRVECDSEQAARNACIEMAITLREGDSLRFFTTGPRTVRAGR